jgi:hypothetical protein
VNSRIRHITVAVLLIGLASPAFAMSARRTKYRSSHKVRAVRWNPLLRGSHESMLRQNEEIDRLALPRIMDDDQLNELIARKDLVPIEESTALKVASNIEANKRYCRPWTENFLTDISLAYYEKFHQPIQVNSAVRTVEQQHKLRKHNRNAAAETGEITSSHLGGLTVDLNKRGLTRKQRQFISEYIYQIKQAGLVEAAEERRQPVFHVMVYDGYTAWREANRMADQSGTK